MILSEEFLLSNSKSLWRTPPTSCRGRRRRRGSERAVLQENADRGNTSIFKKANRKGGNDGGTKGKQLQ